VWEQPSQIHYWRKDKKNVMGRRGRGRKQPLDYLKDRKGCWKLQEEALDCTLWGTRFGRGYGPAVRTDSKMNKWINHHHHITFMELGHLLTRSGLTYSEVSSKVCHDSFCQLGSRISLPWVICFKAFYLHRTPRNFSHWQVSRKETGQIFFKRQRGCGNGITI
jgi:hypothetical protein